jgi:hypothetical protein
MKHMRHVLIVLFTGWILCSQLSACTTAIVSGKFTPDGRPLLFKHRDAGVLQNKLMFFTDGTYEYIGVVNSDDPAGDEIWAGCNSAGFAIMNAASYNMNENDTTSLKDREGIVMKQALQSCATVDDFEKLLERLPKPLGVEANFGVIDAHGGAAYFECGNFDFIKIDANDPQTAPFGYVVRTNYSFARDPDKGYGYIRYLTAEQLFYNAAAAGDLTFQFILQKVSRCLRHSLTGVDLSQNLPKDENDTRFVDFQDFIPRHSSASTVVVQGVRPDESPDKATMWTILGWQLCAVALPTWVKGGQHLPSVLMADDTGNAPLCDMAMRLKKQCFPIERGSGYKYMNLAAVINQAGSGILQRLMPLEDEIIVKSVEALTRWREGGMNAKDIQNHYQWLDDIISMKYKNMFNL